MKNARFSLPSLRGGGIPQNGRRGPARGIGTVAIVAVLVLLGLGVGAYALLAGNWGNEALPDVITQPVSRGPFLHEVVERGEVESSRNVEIRCQVKSRNSAGTAIIEVIPEGTQVKEGDLLVKLDASALEQEIVQQQIVGNTSQAIMIQAKNTFEAAQIARKEYLEGTFIQEEQLIQNEIIVAEENLRRAQQYAKYSEQLAARGYVTALQLEGDQFAVEKAKNELETAQTKLRVLRDYTKAKTLKQLDSDIRTAEAQWESEKSSYELELKKLKELETQISNCTILAPQAGQVVYANEQSSRSSNEFIVEPGATVRERQVIIRLPDPQFMQVDAKINESRVTLLEVGMPAKIRLEAFDEIDLLGEVTKVNEYPEASSWFSSQVKKYGTVISIVDPPSDIRAGLTAEVRIQVDFQEDALQLPVQAIHEHGGKLYCLVQQGLDWDLREIEIAATNDKFAVVAKGVELNELVAMDPRPLLDFVDLPEITATNKETGLPAPQGVVDGPSDSTPRLPGAGTRGPGGRPSGPRGSAADNRPGGPERPSGEGGERGGAPRPGGEANRSAAQVVSRIFGSLDTNKDGKISSDEMPADRKERLSASDTNGDGSVDRAEMTASVEARAGGTQRPGAEGAPGQP